MNAKEIRTTENIGISDTAFWLREIAAQLAELNQREQQKRPLRAWIVTHGKDCPKVQHLGGGRAGYLHDADDDTPYVIDDVFYCGRCHQVLS